VPSSDEDALEATLPASSESDGVPTPRAAPAPLPTTIGRYEVKGTLGAGGMGTVLLAVDPVLGRRVALKVLHPDGRNDNDATRRRLLREAQGIAQLVHEHVVVVHEIGTHDDRVFLAMEHVAGTTLGRWQVGRPWAEIVAAYVKAGRGLAAAHAAGLVHRDFKPDNVLIGDDGRVRVTDFGLVATIEDATTPLSQTAVALRQESELSKSLTRTGAVVGTPRYMAPEQHLGQPIDARADQFAFAVSLYEALFGQPPFVGTTYAELVQHVVAGVPLEIPRATPVPAAIQRAILRGLARQPADRFASMDELLAALATPAAATRRRWPWLIAVGCVAVVAVLVAWILRSRDEAAAARREAARARAEVVALKTGMRDARADARLHFDQAQAAYVGHHYPDAAREFLAAYALTPMPEMLYNAAAAWQMRAKAEGDRAAAIAAVDLYRRYLQAAPAAADRDRVESSIAALEAMATDAAAARP